MIVFTVLIVKKFHFPFFYHDETRLVIDYNRSLHHPKVFSEYSEHLDKAIKEKLRLRHKIYREKIHTFLSKKKLVCHLAIHSFTPVLNGIVRNADIGILYDSRLKKERELALKMQSFLEMRGYRVRLNYPYHGKSDGLTTSLRKLFKKSYLGFEIEVNQSLSHPNEVALDLIECIKALKNQ